MYDRAETSSVADGGGLVGRGVVVSYSRTTSEDEEWLKWGKSQMYVYLGEGTRTQER